MSGSVPALEIVRDVESLRARIKAWRARGETVGLVPTMGALHQGHLALIARAGAYTTRTIVSLFINPTQFGPGEDLAVYPRDEAGDTEKAAAAGAHLLFAPTAATMYPPGDVTRVTVPHLGDILEGHHRPGFFTGVATVVGKLLIQALPDVALFGEKDYQQLLVIKRMVADLHIPVRIESGRTVREEDGLAMSSRNTYLTAEERARAPALYRTLTAVAADVADGAEAATRAEAGIAEMAAAGFASVDYMVVRDAETLLPWSDRARPARILAAARLGCARLIDNVPLFAA